MHLIKWLKILVRYNVSAIWPSRDRNLINLSLYIRKCKREEDVSLYFTLSSMKMERCCLKTIWDQKGIRDLT